MTAKQAMNHLEAVLDSLANDIDCALQRVVSVQKEIKEDDPEIYDKFTDELKEIELILSDVLDDFD